jgi:hypothetical protein
MAIWLYYCAVVPAVAAYLMLRGMNFFFGCVVAVTPMWCAVPLAAIHARVFQRWRPTWLRSISLGVLFGVIAALVTILAAANLHLQHPEETLGVGSLMQPAILGAGGGFIFGLLSHAVAVKRAITPDTADTPSSDETHSALAGPH